MSERVRDAVLDTAKELINGDRNQTYGDATDEFRKVAGAWSAVFGWDVRPEQVAQAMTILKLIRLQQTRDHEDSWNDAAGYIALGAEAALNTPSPVAPRYAPNVLDC